MDTDTMGLGLKILDRLEAIAGAQHNARDAGRFTGSSLANPKVVSLLLSELPAASDANGLRVVHPHAKTLRVLMASHASARVEVAFGRRPSNAASPTSGSTRMGEWYPMVPGSLLVLPEGFSEFRVRGASATPTSANVVVFGLDMDQDGAELGRFAQLSAGGSTLSEITVQRGSDGTEGVVEGADGSAAGLATPAVAGHVQGGAATAYKTIDVDANGRQNVNPIAAQTGVAAGAGVLGATVQRVTIATDDVARTDLDTLAGTVTAARAAVNPIVGQAGVAAGVGATGATVARTISATVATAAATTVTTAGAGSTQAVAANANRKRCVLKNNNTTGSLWYAVGANAVSGTGPKILPGDFWDVEAVGAINVIRDATDALNVSVGAVDESW